MKIAKADKELLKDFALIILSPISAKYTDRGVKPLIEALAKGELAGATVIDRVIGKASALIMAEGKVILAYTKIISKAALQVMMDNGIEIEYDMLVDHILNRNNDGICPMEKLTENINTPKDAVRAIKNRLLKI